MNKSEILLKLEELLLENIQKAEEVYRSSYEYTTKGDIKSDGKYDTRGTEAGYLAGAQKKRVEELKSDLFFYFELQKATSWLGFTVSRIRPNIHHFQVPIPLMLLNTIHLKTLH